MHRHIGQEYLALSAAGKRMTQRAACITNVEHSICEEAVIDPLASPGSTQLTFVANHEWTPTSDELQRPAPIQEIGFSRWI
jgi:hypothetical protein